MLRAAPSMRQVHRAGEKALVDFSGQRPEIVDRRTGEIVPVDLFVGALGASSYIYVEAVADQSLPGPRCTACAAPSGSTRIRLLAGRLLPYRSRLFVAVLT